jgi:aspartyl-tRNA(Asn)/glutamyl-tRNA(Gln) amidotransferase subunit A
MGSSSCRKSSSDGPGDMTALTDLTIAEARDGLAQKRFSARELTAAHVAAVEAVRPLNAFITETPELALAQATESDARLQDGSARPLEGLPLAIKDLFCTKGVLTTAASHILDGFKPPYESTVTQNLWDAGAVMLGKLNLDEFAMGSSTTTSYYGATENPWRRDGDNRALVPGGSSGGSAAAVAARAALGAIGTDTGGSIRQPASFVGIVGLKPTYGRCSRWGTIAFASSLDQAGPMTRSVRDAAIMLKAMAGHDPKDSTSAPLEIPDFEAALTGDISGLKIGIPQEYRVAGMKREIEALWQRGVDWLKDAGAEPVEISLPMTKYALATYYIIAPAEASSNLARYDGIRYGHRAKEAKDAIDIYFKSRAEGFGAEVKRRIILGTYVLSSGYYDAFYLRAQKVRTLIRQDFMNAYREVDALLTPTSPTAAFKIGAKADPLAMYLCDVYTIGVNLAGLPGISVPCGFSSGGLPIGLQLIGQPFKEAELLAIAQRYEQAHDWHTKHPNL